MLIPAAYAYVETHTRRALLDQTIQIDRSCFLDEIKLPNPPFKSLVSFEHRTDSDTFEAVPAESYEIDSPTAYGPAPRAVIRRICDETYPSGCCQRVRVKYLAGYGARWEDLPAQARQVIAMLVNRWELHREGLGNERDIPQAVPALLAQLKDHAVDYGCKEMGQDRRLATRPSSAAASVEYAP